MSFSQNNEEDILLTYFKNEVLTLLSIGENDGITLSNCFALINNQWQALLVEPSKKAMYELKKLHKGNDKIVFMQNAIADYNGKSIFYESGTHLNKGDVSLLSSLSKDEIRRWNDTTEFFETEVEVIDFKTMMYYSPYNKFQFINIDAEGFDLLILKQIDLKELDCKCICIEHNSNEQMLNEIINYCRSFWLNTELLRNAENIIMAI